MSSVSVVGLRTLPVYRARFHKEAGWGRGVGCVGPGHRPNPTLNQSVTLNPFFTSLCLVISSVKGEDIKESSRLYGRLYGPLKTVFTI